MELIKQKGGSHQLQAPRKRLRVVEGSCWPCKDRRVLCDLSNPTCKKCAKANIQCTYGKIRLRWAQNASVKAKSPQQPRLVTDGQLSPLDSAGHWQVLYFEGEVLPRFSMAEGYRSELSWVADQTLHQAVIAISDAHRLLRNHTTTESHLRETVESRAVAIKSFRQKLQADALGPSLDRAFLITVLLCMLDGMIVPWTDGSAAFHHLQGGIAILHNLEDPSMLSDESTGIKPLLFSVFGAMDLTSAVLSGQAPNFDRAWWEACGGKEAWWNGLEDDGELMTVMGVMSQLALLGHQTRSSGAPAPLDELLELQTVLEQSKKPTPVETSPTSADMDALYVAAYRASAKLYMYRALCNLPLSHISVVSSVEEGLSAFADTERLGKLAHCLIFPELIIGCHCTQPDQRRQVLEAIKSAAAYLCFESLKVLTEFLHKHWSHDSDGMDWWTTFEPIAKEGFFF